MQETPVQFLGQKDPWEKAKGYPLQYSWASLVAQLVKNPPVMKDTWVLSLGWEDTLKKRTATHSSILAWSDMTERLSLSDFHLGNLEKK